MLPAHTAFEFEHCNLSVDSKSQDLLGAVMMAVVPDDWARKQRECTRQPQMRSELQQ